jgi:hypothetical protein
VADFVVKVAGEPGTDYARTICRPAPAGAASMPCNDIELRKKTTHLTLRRRLARSGEAVRPDLQVCEGSARLPPA